MSISDNKKIAVIGIGCLFPGSNTKEEFWENILARRQQFRRFVDVRLPMQDYHDLDRKAEDKVYSQYAAYLQDFKFDWAKRLIPKLTYETTDIVHWLSLETAMQALKDAGYERKDVSDANIGVIVGNSLTGEQMRSFAMRLRWPYVERTLKKAGELAGAKPEEITQVAEVMRKLYKSVFPPTTEDSLAGALSNTIAGRICNYMNLKGGGYTVDGACSSSLIAVATAADALVQNKVDIAIAGGVDVSLDTFELVGFARTGALSPDTMHVYDKKAQGFIPGEGAGFVILKKYEDAVRDGNKIYSVLKGWGISSDGKGGITAPDKQGQSLALQRAYNMAGYKSTDVHFIEGHGTGTVVGDKTELEGIALTMNHFGASSEAGRSVGMTSLKSIMGHMKAAAGIGAFIKASLAVNSRILPPTAGCLEPNPAFNTAAKNLYPLIRGEIYDENSIMRAGISAMGFGGINCHVTIESNNHTKIPIKTSLSEDKLIFSYDDCELFPLTGGSREDLIEKLVEFKTEAMRMSFAEMVDVSKALAVRLEPNKEYRLSILAKNPGDLRKKIDQALELISQAQFTKTESNPDRTVVFGKKTQANSIGFVFPGQGSQYLSMARQLVDRYDWAKEKFNIASKLLHDKYSIDLGAVLFKDYYKSSTPEENQRWEQELAQTAIAQPAICFASALWIDYLEKMGVRGEICVGHSLGELTSFYYSKALDFSELIELAAYRGQLMSASAEKAGSMASLMCNAEDAKKIIQQIKDYITIANLNSPKQTIVSGAKSAIEELLRVAAGQGVQAVQLNVSNAFHSLLVKESSEQIKNYFVGKDAQRQLSLPVVSSMTGHELSQQINMTDYFSKQIISPVDFITASIEIAKKCDILIEVGPGSILSNLIQANLPSNHSKLVLNMEKKNLSTQDLKSTLSLLFVSGVDINWEALFASRLVRNFVPFAKKTFIENPLERPYNVPELGLNGLRATEAEARFFGENYLDQVKELNSKTLLANEKPFVSLVASNQTVQKPVEDYQQPSAAGALVDLKKVESSILQLVCDKTGFPAEMINFDMRMIEDLNLDSIKSGEIVAAIGAEYDVSDKIDMSVLTKGTLQNLLDAVIGQAVARQPMQQSQSYAMASGFDYSESYSSKKQNSRFTAEKELPVQNSVTPNLIVPHVDLKKVESSIMQLVCDKTGFPAEMINFEMRMIEDLNLDSIKSGEIVAAIGAEYDVSDKIDMSVLTKGTLKNLLDAVVGQAVQQSLPVVNINSRLPSAKELPEQKPIQNSVTPHVDLKKVESSILQLVCDKTGFPAEMINFDMRMIEDLNLDSIKSGEIVAAIGAEYDVSDKIDMSVLTKGTLQNLLDAVSGQVAQQPVQQPAQQPVQQPVQQAQQNSVTPSAGLKKVESSILQLVCDKTGFPAEMINFEMRMIEDLNLDSIKSGEIVAAIGAEYDVSDKIDMSVLTKGTLQNLLDAVLAQLAPQPAQQQMPQSMPAVNINSQPLVKQATSLPGQQAAGAVIDVIMSELEQATSIPKNLLSVELRLQDDFGFSREQCQKLIKTICDKLKIGSSVDIDVIQNFSIQELNKIFTSMKLGHSLNGVSRGSLKNYNRWIRNFKVHFKAQARDKSQNDSLKRYSDKLEHAQVLIVADKTAENLAGQISMKLTHQGSSVEIKDMNTIVQTQESLAGKYSHIFFVMPSEQSTDLKKQLELMTERIAFLRKILPSGQNLRRHRNLVFVQFGNGDFRQGFHNPTSVTSEIHGVASALNKEYSDYKIRVVNAPLNINPELLAQEIIQEVVSTKKFEVLGFDYNLTRYVYRLDPIEPETKKANPIAWSNADVVLVSGGAKGITSECAMTFAKKYHVKLALLGSSPLDNTDPNLQRFVTENIQFKYYQCDVSDGLAVKNTVSTIEKELGVVTGVIHGAGRNVPRLFGSVSGQNAFDEVSTKVMGINNILSSLQENKVKLVTALTSILGIDNVPGNAWYGYSNDVCHHIVRQFKNKNPSCHTVCYAYGMWAEVGMAARLQSEDRFANMGVKPLPIIEGVNRFIEFIENKVETDEIVITSGIWDLSSVLEPALGKPAAQRFLQNKITALDQVEVLCQTHINLEDDKYIMDHCFNGNYLFPTVLGLEAMAQAAAYVTGIHNPETVSFENIILDKPITVHPQKGVNIQVHAVVLEGEDSLHSRIKCSIRTEVTQFKVDHFSAVLTFGKIFKETRSDLTAHKPLDIDIPALNKLLFQGPTYKKFDKINKFTSRDMIYESKQDLESEYLKKAFSDSVKTPLILGDPYFRDSLLQSLEAIYLKCDSLPVSCPRWEIKLSSNSELRIVEGVGRRNDQLRELNGEIVAINKDGVVYEKLSNICYKIIKDTPERPAPEDFYSQQQVSPKNDNVNSLSVDKVAVKVSHGSPHDSHVAPNNYDQGLFSMHVDQLYNRANWPVVFKDCTSFGRGVSVPSVIDWIGRMRELSVRASLPGVAEKFLSGEFGWVTNSQDLKIFNIPQHGDIVECEYRIKPLKDRADGSLEHYYRWTCQTEVNGAPVVFAEATMKTTWVRIVSHGVVVAEPFPADVRAGIESYFKNEQILTVNDSLSLQLMGPSIITQYPDQRGFVALYEKEIQTTLQDSNVVGNIYYSNYAKWLGQVSDTYFAEMMPGLKSSTESGEPVGIYNTMTFLREAMPFDKIYVKMLLRDLRKSGLRLMFEFYKELPSGGREKISFAYHDVVWSKTGREISPISLPSEILNPIFQQVEQYKQKKSS